MDRNGLLALLDQQGIEYEITEHPPVFTIEDMINAQLPYPEKIAKNLFVRDGKKRSYFLITVREDRSISLKNLQELLGVKGLSFASENDLMMKMGLTKGSVTPFGLLNNDERDIKFCIGEELLGTEIGIHPLENTSTLWMETDCLIRMISDHGNGVISF